MLTYSIITPARDEAGTLPALALALAEQTVRPLRWVIVEGGSSDATGKVAEEIDAKYDWAQLIVLPATAQRERGAPIVRAINAGLGALEVTPDILVNVDADVTMEPDYFERLLEAFGRDESLGIASGSAWELDEGIWRQRFVTGGTVWGATRAYRWACLQDVFAARKTSRLGRHRPVEGPIARLANEDIHRPAFPTPPRGGAARRIEMEPLAGQWRYRLLHGLPALVPGRPNAAPHAAGRVGLRFASWIRVRGPSALPAVGGSSSPRCPASRSELPQLPSSQTRGSRSGPSARKNSRLKPAPEARLA